MCIRLFIFLARFHCHRVHNTGAHSPRGASGVFARGLPARQALAPGGGVWVCGRSFNHCGYSKPAVAIPVPARQTGRSGRGENELRFPQQVNSDNNGGGDSASYLVQCIRAASGVHCKNNSCLQ